MALLDREAILNAPPSRTEDVEVPEWGGTVRIRPMTAQQRAHVESVTYEVQSAKRGYERLSRITLQCVAWCVVGEDGKTLFTEDDLKRLGGLDAAPVLRIREAVTKLSGIKEGAVEEAETDLEPGPDGSSSTGSPPD